VSSKIRFVIWHFLLISHPVGIASGPVQAEDREPKGSRDGWRDARSCIEGGNARPSSKCAAWCHLFQVPHPKRPLNRQKLVKK
jgi:hypothetical protein